MSETHLQFRSLGKGWLGGLAATLAIHGGLVFVLWNAQRRPVETRGESRDLIVTQLVKLGKPREKFWLPRISEPRQTAPKQQIKISDNPEAAPAPKEAPRPENPQVSNQVRRALERARLLQDTSEDDDEGQLDGSPLGSAKEAVAGDAYATQLNAAIRAHWNVPVGIISAQELSRLTARVRIKVQPDGSLTDEQLLTSSGNDTFDDSCMQAIQATGKVPPPPTQFLAQYPRGVAIVFKPNQ